MAPARLLNPEILEGGKLDGWTAYEVEAYVDGEKPFAGPDDRNWNDFAVTTGEDEATFQWRTRNDRVSQVATAFEKGKISLKEALSDPAVSSWIELRFENIGLFVDDLLADPGFRTENPEPGLIDDGDSGDLASESYDELVLQVGAGLGNYQGSLSAYLEDDDQPFHDAATALDLPRWARALARGAGGPGSGFDQAMVALAPGKTLDDLAAWLKKRAAGGGRKKR